jgi:unsaturated chondroitin disaccharide hydrolase
MKQILIILIAVIAFSCNSVSKQKPMKQVVDEALNSALHQSLLMAEKYEKQDSILPRSFVNGDMTTSDSRWWTSGFFPGTLWYLYESSKDEKVLAYAKQYTARIEREKYTTNNHDVGFMLNCSFGNGLRLTGDTTYKEVLLTGAKSLSTRFNPKVGLIRSWDFNQDIWQYPVIIDNMMNLELLLEATKLSGEESFKDIAISHADKTMENHYRPDFSCYHVVSYDTITGLPHKKQTHQGYSDESSWSRGQAWGLYGYTFMYRETKDQKYLTFASNIVNYLINHPRMPKDFIPYWDFDAPEIPNEPRDASAAALMASALIELSQYVDTNLSEKYIGVAETQIRTLTSPEYTANLGANGDFILKHSTGSKPHNSEVDVPLTYTDYYYLEALVRYKKLVLETKKNKK